MFADKMLLSSKDIYTCVKDIVSNSGICESCIYKSNVCKSILRMSLSCTCFIVFKVSYTCMQIHFLTFSNTRICRNCINVQWHICKKICDTSVFNQFYSITYGYKFYHIF